MTAIVTAIFGDFDDLRPQVEQDIDVEWIAYTDHLRHEPPAPWRVILHPAWATPRLMAKGFKCRPRTEHDDVIWIDGSHQITSRSFAREVLTARHDGLAVFAHPRRDCIYEEAEASVGAESQSGKYDGQPIMEQVEHYRSEGHPAHGGLYACGVVAWDLRDPRAVQLGWKWIEEIVNWSEQDQLSLPVVARRLQVSPGVFPVRQIERSNRQGFLSNRWLRIWPHKVTVG